MKFSLALLLCFNVFVVQAQISGFDYGNHGQRVCLASATVDTSTGLATIKLLDATQNNTTTTAVFRRSNSSQGWQQVITNLPAGTTSFTDFVPLVKGQQFEYYIKRNGTFNYNGIPQDASGFTFAVNKSDKTSGRGKLILLTASDIPLNCAAAYQQFKIDLANELWDVQEIIVPRAHGWDSGDTVVTIRSQIQSAYNNAPTTNKPKLLIILGHVPLPRSGSTNVTAPDEHDENKGARGNDGYYADIDGTYTDIATFNPGNLATNLAINYPFDYKWDQDFYPSTLEMGFGRIDFADLTDFTESEYALMTNYLNRLHLYKTADASMNMGRKLGYYIGYDNSNDGTFRSFPNMAKNVSNLVINNSSLSHPQWVSNNGPFMMYMQNLTVPNINEWKTHGMNATIFTSDQSYYGFGDVPQNYSIYSTIRSLLGVNNSKCLASIWTTTGVNMFQKFCTGASLGETCLDIINHNATNSILPKPQQTYDTYDWWHRTHFAIYGDPSIRLYQINPPTDVKIKDSLGLAYLQWQASTNANGYGIYEASNQYGPYQLLKKVSSNETSAVLNNYTSGKWYMVNTLKEEETGCGIFINSSIGVSVEANVNLGMAHIENKITLSPNPVQTWLNMNGLNKANDITIINSTGTAFTPPCTTSGNITSVDCSNLASGIYVLRAEGRIYKFVKQ